MQSEEQLIRLLFESGQGNRVAFQKLYESTSTKMFATAMYLLNEKDLAEEAFQESFVHIWYKSSSYQIDKGNPFAWMITILRNQCFDILRREHRHHEKKIAFEVDADLFVNFQHVNSSELQALNLLELELLQKCLQELDNEQRKSLLMSYYFGFSHAEMVQQFKKPLGTIKSWVRRGMLMVRECMDK